METINSKISQLIGFQLFVRIGILVLLGGGLIVLSPPVAAQASLGLYPGACAYGGFGRDHVFNRGNVFRVTQPVRITHLCRLMVAPQYGDDVTGMTVQLWSLGLTNTVLASAVMGTNVGEFCLDGSDSLAIMLGTQITPALLFPGDYLVRELVKEIGDGNDHWVFGTSNFQTGPGITFIVSASDYFSPFNFGGPPAFGPSFLYELANDFPPHITVQPTNQTAEVGAAVSFNSEVLGPQPINFQWFSNDVSLAGATNETVTLTNAAAGLSTYFVVASNSYGATTSSVVTLTVYGLPPVITAQPTDQRTAAGGNVAFSVMASGSLPITFQWFSNSNSLTGETNTTLPLTNLSAGVGAFFAVASNAFGSATSSIATLIVFATNCTPAPAGLIAWWPGQSNAFDIVGGNNATLQNGATYGSGMVGQGFRLDGVDDFLSLDPAKLPLGKSPRTIEAWVRTSMNGLAEVFSYGTGVDGKSLSLGVLDGAIFVSGWFSPQYSVNANVNNGFFHHIAFAYDGTNASVYCDGSLLDTRAFDIYTVSDTANIGARIFPTEFFNGDIDEVGVFDRALSSSEIAAICIAGPNGICAPDHSRPGSIVVRVDGRSGPWSWNAAVLNTNFQYGLNNHQGPTVISAADGFDFTPGNVLAVEYVSGLVYQGGGWPLNDAGGALWADPADDSIYLSVSAPSFYFDHTDYPAYSAALAGTFANGSGVIVGTPFKVGNFRYLTIPPGATCLQLGDNDGEYSDNGGSWQIRVSAVPKLEITSSGHFILHTPAGTANRVEYISEMGATNWQTLTNVVVKLSPQVFTDPEFGQTTKRFYRAILLP